MKDKSGTSCVIITILLCISVVLPIVGGVLFVILASLDIIELKL